MRFWIFSLFISMFLMVSFHRWPRLSPQVEKYAIISCNNPGLIQEKNIDEFKCWQILNPEFRPLFKAGSIFLLIPALYLAPTGERNIKVFGGLLAHSIGDFLLDLNKFDPFKLGFNPKIYFYLALLGFMAGHLLYYFSFKSMPKPKEKQCMKTQKTLIFCLRIFMFVIASFMTLQILTNLLSTITVPKMIQSFIIVVYITVVAAMVLSALETASFISSPRLLFSIILGPFSYAISDCFIGYGKFVGPIGILSQFTWPMYYIGQILICSSIWLIPLYHKSQNGEKAKTE